MAFVNSPKVTLIKSTPECLKLTMANVNVSHANALRRIMLSDIPVAVLKSPVITINTSRMNNEILKQRLRCVPVHMLPDQREQYQVYLHVKNLSQTVLEVTTNDFKLISLSPLLDLTMSTTNTLPLIEDVFPPADPGITKKYFDKLYYILLLRLLPEEEIELNCPVEVDHHSNDGSFNVVSELGFQHTQVGLDVLQQLRKEKQKLLQDEFPHDDAAVQSLLLDWDKIDAKRHTVPDSFDFSICSAGAFTNKSILMKAILIMLDKLEHFLKKSPALWSKQDVAVTNVEHCFHVSLDGKDDTLGRVLEYHLLEMYYEKDKRLSFCSYNAPHPHLNESYIRLVFNSHASAQTLHECLETTVSKAKTIYMHLYTLMEKLI
jgi:DNA-directed RNA polymerase subunit L